MKFISLFFLLLCLISCQHTPTIKHKSIDDNIERAKAFSAKNLSNKVHNFSLTAHWIDDKADEFWFERYSEKRGQEFVRVNAHDKVKTPLFDKVKLTQSLNLEEPIDWQSSPLSHVKFNGKVLNFDINNQPYRCDIVASPYQCRSASKQKSQDKTRRYTSPDKQHFVKVENYNLFLCKTSTQDCKQLTEDGSESSPYAVTHSVPNKRLNDEGFDEQNHLGLYWSENSHYVITYRLFRQGVTKLTLTDSTADNDFNVNSVRYYYPQAGDQTLPMAQVVLIDVVNQEASALNAPKVMQTYYGRALWGYWHKGDFYYQDRRRGNKTLFLRKVIAKEKQVVSVIKETNDEFIDPWVQVSYHLNNKSHVIWSSQRSGYQHLYLYDTKTGSLINPITQGEYTVRAIRGVDEENGVLYFEASGKEKNRDPYLRHLYRINLDGSDLTLLTPEPFEHNTRLSPNFNYFIDTFSDAKTPPQSWLRSAVTGEKLTQLDQANIGQLTALGWQPPEPFSVIADDGVTPLYGLLYKPSNFDASKKYPVINDTYTGPHNFFTPKSFSTFANTRPALAELGFIVIKMDGRGTSKRGREFHRVSYKNLAAGTDDHVWAIKQLAKDRQYMDINRVGIYGFSAGGYDTVQAMLRHNSFFSAGVSASGNHDFRVDKAGWNEIWMSWPMSEAWQQQSNYTNVERLKGKLLLAHGELDNNVHLSATMRLVDKLIDANKDFDLLIMPKMGHVLDEHPYFVEKRWRFFIEHLQEDNE
ncbi:DPP IV N-terminal domain-containing protein [Thalassotalea sp. PP2-459]|uniref:S9 family peptidase n=1 Tax=Thalassotalea sp. PP2-459 TaxID=1742724 RepID=UPI000944FD15|nr:DPP IV N-terminal domain-containing protein [Thalassotalea sp. PP2-459]OKY27365.1 hypothetical protein BI291_00630 [Thalassotalea sp. PP2-459]